MAAKEIEELKAIVEQQQAELAELKERLTEKPMIVRIKELECELPPFGEAMENAVELLQFISGSEIKAPKGWKLTKRSNRVKSDQG